MKLTERLVIVPVRSASISPTCAVIANNLLLLSSKPSLHFLGAPLQWHTTVSGTREDGLCAASKPRTGDQALQREEDCSPASG